MKKLALVLVFVFAFAIPALANPFVDVPLNHWAYDAVQTLAAKGVVIGYPDGTFGGQRTLTRYEFAEATARLLAYVEQYGGMAEDLEILSKLAVEFADELASLGVTVADLEAAVGAQSEAVAAMKELVDKHEKFFEPVKITGKSNVEYKIPVYPTLGAGVLKDSTDLTFTVEINETTTLGFDIEVENILSKSAAFDPGGGDFWLKHYGEDLSLWIGDIAPATIGLGLIYDAGRVDNVFSCDDLSYYGVWAQWMWNNDEEDDEDLGTWTTIMKPDDFYLLNVAFNVGDDEDVPIGVTAGWDRKAAGFVAGANISFDLTDEEDEDQAALALEGGVFVDELFTTTDFGVAANLSATLGDEDDIDAYVDAWYTTAGFVPTLSGYGADELGVELGVTFSLTDEEDEEDVQVAINPYWSYVMDSAMAINKKHYVGVELDFTNIDEDHPETEAYILAEYYLVPAGEIYVEGQLLNLILGDDEDEELSNFIFNIYGDYTFAATPDYTVVANFIYNFEDEPMKLIVEGRYDSQNAGIPYSAEAKLIRDLDKNTSLYIGAEMNDWKADINEWDSLWCEGKIQDDVTKIYAGIDVKF